MLLQTHCEQARADPALDQRDRGTTPVEALAASHRAAEHAIEDDEEEE